MECQLERHLMGNCFRKFLDRQQVDICRKYGVKKVSLDVLLYIARNAEENTARDIQHYLNINKGYLSQVLDGLCTDGYLQAVPDQTDRRYVHYTMTALVKPLLEELLLVRRQVEEKLFSGISAEELKLLEQISRKIDANMQNLLENGV